MEAQEDAMKFPLPCFVCGRELEPATHGPEEVVELSAPPSGGLHFTSPGNYGSTVWDPACELRDGPKYYLEINVCDGCVRERQNRLVTVRESLDVRATPRSGIVDPDDWEAEGNV
jgi:hypothetical protein